MANLVDTLKKVIADAIACVSKSDYAAVEAVVRPIVGELYKQKKPEMVSVVRKATAKVLVTGKTGWVACARCNSNGYWVKEDGTVMNGYTCMTCGGCGMYSVKTGIHFVKGMHRIDNGKLIVKPTTELRESYGLMVPVVLDGVSVSLMLEDNGFDGLVIALWQNGKIIKSFVRDNNINKIDSVNVLVRAVVKLSKEFNFEVLCVSEDTTDDHKRLVNTLKEQLGGVEVYMSHGETATKTSALHYSNGVEVEIIKDDDRQEEPYKETWIDIPGNKGLETTWKANDEIFPKDDDHSELVKKMQKQTDEMDRRLKRSATLDRLARVGIVNPLSNNPYRR